MIMSQCPECTATVTVAVDAKVGEVLHCPDCQAQLEIISLSPVKLILAPEVEEDWGE